MPGPQILVESMPHARSISLGFWVRRGSCHEGPGEEGLAHFLEHTVFKGTERYPTPETVAEATERLGGHVDAFTGKEVACFYGKVLPDQLPGLVDLLTELVTTPRFEADELARERDVILEEIAASEDTPDDWVSECFYGGFWKDTPLAHPILGRPHQVSAYGPEAARAYFRQVYRAPNLLISAAGAVSADQLGPLLEPLLRTLPAGDPDPEVAPCPPTAFLENVPRKGLQQANLVLGFPAPGHRSEDRAVLHLLNQVLGGGMASRLFMELRERRGLCYQVGSFLAPYATSGALQISASCAPRHARDLVSRAMQECLKIRERGITAEELDRARLQARTSLVFGQEGASSRMFSQAHQVIHWGGLKSLDDQLAELEAVTQEDVHRVAREVLDPARLGCMALGVGRGTGIREADLS